MKARKSIDRDEKYRVMINRSQPNRHHILSWVDIVLKNEKRERKGIYIYDNFTIISIHIYNSCVTITHGDIYHNVIVNHLVN